MKLNDQINEAIDDLMESDDFYIAKSTPLKPASACKAEHRKELEDIFQMHGFDEKIQNAVSLIINSDILTQEDKNKLETDFFAPLTLFDPASIDDLTDSSFIPQIQAGITNETMGIIYNLGSKLIQDNKGEDAISIFTLLAFLNPIFPGYWIGLMMANFNAKKFQETIDLSQTVTDLSLNDVVGYIYRILAKRQLDPQASLDEELTQIHTLFDSNPAQKELWQSTINSL